MKAFYVSLKNCMTGGTLLLIFLISLSFESIETTEKPLSVVIELNSVLADFLKHLHYNVGPSWCLIYNQALVSNVYTMI